MQGESSKEGTRSSGTFVCRIAMVTPEFKGVLLNIKILGDLQI